MTGCGPDERGFPREKLPYSPARGGSFQDLIDARGGRQSGMKPNIWMGGRAQKRNNWTSLVGERTSEAFGPYQDDPDEPFRQTRAEPDHPPCLVCGEPCEGFYVMGRLFTPHGMLDTFDGPRKALPHKTDGPGGHPRCIWMARNVCPHFQTFVKDDRQTVAFVWPFVGHGLADPYGNGLRSGVKPGSVPINTPDLHDLAKQSPLGLDPWKRSLVLSNPSNPGGTFTARPLGASTS